MILTVQFQSHLMDKQFALKYNELEQNHWWFKARSEILKNILNHHLTWTDINKALEIGTSSGNNLYKLYPRNIDICGVEPFEQNIAIAQRKGNIPVLKGTAEQLPPKIDRQTFDLITMFDVLEHTKDDNAVLKNIHNHLTDQGFLFITVPAYQWMWGAQDVISHHYRRYTLTKLRAKIEKTGFKTTYSTYFNTFLFPPIAAIRGLAKLKPEPDEHGEFGDFKYGNSLSNALLYHIFRAEKWFLPPLKFPFGVSVLIVANKN